MINFREALLVKNTCKATCGPLFLSLMLLVANLANTKACKKTEKSTETLAHGQGLNQDFHNRESKMGFQEDRVSKPPR